MTGKLPEDHAGEVVSLRAFREDDLPFLDRLCTDPDALGYFEWTGFVDVRSRRRRWEKDGYVGADSTGLAIVLLFVTMTLAVTAGVFLFYYVLLRAIGVNA